MKKNLLKTMLVAVAMVMGANNVLAEEVQATLDFTAACQGGSNAAGKSYNEVTHYYNNWGTSAWVAQAYAGFSFTIPDGLALKTATLNFTSNAGRGDRTIDVCCMNGADFDYETLALITKAQAGTFIKTLSENATKSTKTLDVTDAVKAYVEAGATSVVFVFSNAAAGGTLQGYGSDEKPTLTLDLADMSTQTSYTVKFVDEEGIELKASSTRSGTIGDPKEPTNEDLAAIWSNGVKYIWQSDNSPITLVADPTANVINIVFAPAPLYHYELQSTLGALASGEAYADETVYVGYPRYYWNKRGAMSNLYEAAKSQSSAGWYLYGLEMTEDYVTGNVEYNIETPAVENVAYYAELENVEGMTSVSENAHNVRCSNGAGGYNGTDADITLTTLEPGNYLMRLTIRGSKNAVTMPLLIGDERLEFVTDGNLQEFNQEIKLTSSAAVVIPAGSGNGVNVYDFIYFQSVPETVNFTVKSTTGETIYEGSYYQGLETTVAVPKYIWNKETKVLYQTANNGSKGWYQHGITPEYDGQIFEIEYTEAMTDVYFYAEAEDIEGMTKATGSNADIRCSMGAGAYNAGDEPIFIYQIGSGDNLIVIAAVWGGEGTTLTINIGDTPFEMTTTGSHTELSSEPFPGIPAKDFTIPTTGNGSHPLDYIIIKKDTSTGIQGVKQVISESNAIFNLAGQEVKTALKGVFIQNGKKVVK